MNPKDFFKEIIKALFNVVFEYILWQIFKLFLVLGLLFLLYQSLNIENVSIPKEEGTEEKYHPPNSQNNICAITFDVNTGEPIKPASKCNLGYWKRVEMIKRWQKLHRNWEKMKTDDFTE